MNALKIIPRTHLQPVGDPHSLAVKVAAYWAACAGALDTPIRLFYGSRQETRVVNVENWMDGWDFVSVAASTCQYNQIGYGQLFELQGHMPCVRVCIIYLQVKMCVINHKDYRNPKAH